MFETKTRPGCKLASGVNENRVNFSSFLMYMVRFIPLHAYQEKKLSMVYLLFIHLVFPRVTPLKLEDMEDII